MQDRIRQLRNLFLVLVPSDGSTIGNQKLLTTLKHRITDITEQEYVATRDALVHEGYLGKGRGRGGSVYLAAHGVDADTTNLPDDETFELEAQEPNTTATSSGKHKTPGTRGKTKPTQTDSAQVLSYRHQDTRVNNPEVGMVHADNDPDQEPTTWSYDPHIDPALQFDVGRADIENLIDTALASGDQNTMREALAELKRMQQPYLNWTGKAERTTFEVDTVSLHVHERIDPATILSKVRNQINKETTKDPSQQGSLFEAPFERLPLRKALDFYKHEKNWSNRLIAGDSLLVMNSLLQKESMAGQVQMIYMDPPYGIKYGSNFQPFTNKRDVKDGEDSDLTQEPEMIKAFRDTWELGVHSYLTYLRDRMLLSRELLSESGSIFVQISDENLHRVRAILDEVFGAENFVRLITFSKTTGQTDSLLASVSDYILWYAKNRKEIKYRQLWRSKTLDAEGGSAYGRVQNPDLSERTLSPEERRDPHQIAENAKVFRADTLTSQSPGTKYTIKWQGRAYYPKGYWKTQETSMPRLQKANRLVASKNNLYYRRFFDDFAAFPYTDNWSDTSIAGFTSDKMYVVQTTPKVVQRCLLMATDPGDLVLDPTCGSGTTPLVAEQWGRRWIAVDTSRVALTLTKQRLMTNSYAYYKLRYPEEGLKGGFVYKTLPHIQLQNIANNPDIDEIYSRMHPKVREALDALNAALKGHGVTYQIPKGGREGEILDFSAKDNETIELPSGETAYRNSLEEWEVPPTFPENWPESAYTAFQEFHRSRIAMQTQIDRSIATHAPQEPLYDQPIVDERRLRVTGPFTVEAVPSPTVKGLDGSSQVPGVADDSVARTGETSRQALWRDELVKTGIRGKNGQNMRIAELEAIPGLKHLHASGTLAESEERVVVSFGPEHAALEQRQVEAALDEAEKLRPKPKYIIFCAFTFDPEAAKDIDETNWPGATLLKAQMATDLLTEDLKKGRTSEDSFWLMGQPDVEVRSRDDGRYEVEVSGFDYFDPQKGELISGGKKNIAMWTLDTDYDNRSLMAHQVFFPMAGEKDGWHRLKKTVRAELDEDLLKDFHGTVSLPFESGDHQRVAVKIVDDRGIESLKIIPLDA